MLFRSLAATTLLGALACIGCGVNADGTFKRALLMQPEPTPAAVKEYQTLAPRGEEPAKPESESVPGSLLKGLGPGSDASAPPFTSSPPYTAPQSPTVPSSSQATAPPPPTILSAPSTVHQPLSTSSDPLADLYRKATEKYATFDSYIARLRRVEQVNGKEEPEEVLLVKFRKAPWSVYFKWLGTVHKGREVTYVKGKYDDKMYTYLASGDMPFMPAGKVISLAPDSAMIRGRCRHLITEAGIGNLLEQYAKHLQRKDANGNRALRYLGPQKRPECETPLETVEQTIAPNVEPMLEGGGRRFMYFDPTSGLPVLVITQDKAGHQVEYYCWDRFQFPAKLDDQDFNPEFLGKHGQ